ncbi:MAG: hypothetical protein P5695_00195 [Limnospira sp. PMC 1281.21]|uniref:hypothetical protein n=1 Tax=Limnospira sp. PMC 1281.21 TaxID=2981064 RepID=UPI0028E16979|nr:hypothetical protein [Limnospira sp. PMC 1281.21]MDT9298669.1 hypothetical protein [Limnospira sp. PMC 1281.21]
MTMIYIHEFSTGIEVKRTSDGGWESGGFTGQYMNCTREIPPEILNAISSGEFSLSEGGLQDHPAIVGRQVGGYSVVAVVSRGRDDRGRGLSLYRYFWCEGKDYIEAILRTMISRPSNKVDPLVFDPYNQPPSTGYPLNPDSQPVSLDKLAEYLDSSPPIVIPHEQPCTHLILNEIAKEIAKRQGQDYSWAYKVAALENPWYFQVIYPASSEAEDNFKEVLARRPRDSVFISGEAGIKTAIKAIIKGRVKPEHINSLEIALAHPQIDAQFWNKLLDGLGASKAYKDKIYSEPMVRLLTLKALLIPKFLPEFLIWMQTAPKPDDCWEFCRKLQASIVTEYKKKSGDLPCLTRNVKDGIYSLLSRLITKPKFSPSDSTIKHKLRGLVHYKFYIPQLVKATKLLLTQKDGFWSQVYRVSFTKDLADALTQIPDLWEPGIITNYPEEQQNFLTNLQQFWQYPGRIDKNYLSLAQFFEEVKLPHFAAIFYQISTGEVPPNIFSQVSPRRHIKQGKLFEMMLIRKKGWRDHIHSAFFAGINFVKDNFRFILRGMVIGLLLGAIGLTTILLINILEESMVIIGLLLGTIGLTTILLISSLLISLYDKALQASRKKKIATLKEELTSAQASTTDTNNPETLTEISPENQELFNRTHEAIKAMITNLTDDINQLPLNTLNSIGIPEKVQDNNEYIVLFCVKQILRIDQNLQYGEIRQYNERWQKFSDAIWKYQEKKGANTPDGVIDKDGRTRGWLEEDIRNQCLNQDGG